MNFNGLVRSYRWADGVKLACLGQRIFDSETGQLVKVELLSRPIEGVESQNIEAFFHKLPVKAHLDIVKWQVHIAREIYSEIGVPICINVDNQIFLEEQFTKVLFSIVEGNVIPLVFEFTEMNPMPSVDRVHPVFRALREQGVEIALDDFGTGFNGMSLFIDYDFDVVKIDRALVKDVTLRAKKAQVLGLLADMIKTLGKSHVVEGVETEQQLIALQRLGFSTFQGYFFHRPELINQLLNNHSQPYPMEANHELSIVR